MRSPFASFLLVAVTIAGVVAGPARAQEPKPAPVAAAAPAKVKVLVMDVAAAGLDASTVENITGLVAVILTEDTRLDVLSGADVKQMAALEGERQAMGCTSDASCLADIAGAMGAGLIVYGNGGKLGTLLNLNLNLFDAAQARSVGRVAIQAKSLEELPEKLKPALAQLIANGIGAPALVTPPPAPAASGPGMLPIAAIGGGGALAVVGVVLAIVGALPAGDVAAAEEEFKAGVANGDADAQSVAIGKAQAVRASWYDNGLAPALLVSGVVAGVAGAALVGVGVAMMGGAE